jgi:hypothetical protein
MFLPYTTEVVLKWRPVTNIAIVGACVVTFLATLFGVVPVDAPRRMSLHGGGLSIEEA